MKQNQNISFVCVCQIWRIRMSFRFRLWIIFSGKQHVSQVSCPPPDEKGLIWFYVDVEDMFAILLATGK